MFGADLGNLTVENVHGLVAAGVRESFDLDYKRQLYGRGDSDRRALAGDVAALANTAGGVIVLGVEEDEQAKAVSAPGVEITDAEIRRMTSIIASLVAPIPVFDIVTVGPSTTTLRAPMAGTGAGGHEDAADAIELHGFLVVAVPRSPAAPHAVLVHEGLRYPKRNGSTTRYLSEPEVAAAYRDRLAAGSHQADHAFKIEREALTRLNPSEMPWVVISLVPDLAGEMLISSESFRAFCAEVKGKRPTILSGGIRIHRASVGPRRLLADGTTDGSPLAKWISLEMHADGSGVCGIAVRNLAHPPQYERDQDDRQSQPQMLEDEAIAVAVVSGLLHLGEHARERAAAGGNAVVRAQLWPVSNLRPTRLGQRRQMGFTDALGDKILDTPPPPAQTAAALDELTPGPTLVKAAAALINEIGQAFGVAEMGQFSLDGHLRRPYWSDTQALTWAELHGIEVTSEEVT